MSWTQANIKDFSLDRVWIYWSSHSQNPINKIIYLYKFRLENKVSKGNLVQGQYNPYIIMLVWQISQKF